MRCGNGKRAWSQPRTPPAVRAPSKSRICRSELPRSLALELEANVFAAAQRAESGYLTASNRTLTEPWCFGEVLALAVDNPYIAQPHCLTPPIADAPRDADALGEEFNGAVGIAHLPTHKTKIAEKIPLLRYCTDLTRNCQCLFIRGSRCGPITQEVIGIPHGVKRAALGSSFVQSLRGFSHRLHLWEAFAALVVAQCSGVERSLSVSNQHSIHNWITGVGARPRVTPQARLELFALDPIAQ